MGLTRFAGCHPGKLRHRAGFSIDPTVMLIVAVPMPGCRQISSGSLQGEFSHGLQEFCNAGCATAIGFIQENSVEPQSSSKLIIIHAGKIISRIHISCSAEEEFIESRRGTGT
jgi:hypothetical protein